MSADLLPVSASEAERDIAQAQGDRIEAIEAPIETLWAQDQIPTAWLPVVAWGLSVDEWDPAWSEGRMRDVIAEAIAVQRRKGSIGSVRRVLGTLGHGDAVITEGVFSWHYGDGSAYGDPGLVYGDGTGWAYYQVDLQQPITPAQGQFMRRLLGLTAPVRCHLYALTYLYAPWVYGDGSVYGAPLEYYAAGGVA